MKTISIVVLSSLLLATRAGAQCTDGGQPPCRQPAVAKPIDPNRVAVLPFRVATADTLLGEGFAELLAQEFTGEGGPRSVDMSSTLSAWRHAGGGLRSPLPLDSAMILARRLGAGILLQGNIAGLAGRLSITATMVNAATAAPIGQPARAAGPADSVETLLRQVAAGLLGAGASERVLKSARLSKNPAALRSYLEGLALWRRGYTIEALKAFERSVAADSLFASAAYQRWLMGRAYAGRLLNNWAPEVRKHIDLLTPRERTVFEADAGKGEPRTAAESYRDHRRAAEQLGDSPEAWFLVGDNVFHAGTRTVGPDSVILLARQFFSIALGLDTQPVYLFHMSDLAVNTRDSALMRRLLPAYANVEANDQWIHRWIFANGLGDEAMLASLRRAGPPRKYSSISELGLGAVITGPVSVPAMEYAISQGPAASREEAVRFLSSLDLAHGRVAAAAARPRGEFKGMSSGTFDVSGDPMDSVTLARIPSATLPDTIEARRQCLRARLMLERGETVALDSASIRLLPRCRNALLALDAFNRGTLTDSAVTRLDSLATNVAFGTFLGFEHRLLARIYESRGDTARAVRAIKLHPYDYGGPWTAPTHREAGRLFLMAKDTARAIEEYQRFLELRTEAQPPLIAERDSIKAIVSRLKNRLTP